MSNVIDHDEISEKVEKLFESAIKNLKESQGKTDEEIKYTEFKLGESDASICEGNLIHLTTSTKESITLHKDLESREYKIIKISDENEGEFLEGDVELLSKFNISDDPATKVYVGSSASEMYHTLKSIDDTTTKIDNDTKKKLELKKEEPKKQVKKTRASRPGRTR